MLHKLGLGLEACTKADSLQLDLRSGSYCLHMQPLLHVAPSSSAAELTPVSCTLQKLLQSLPPESMSSLPVCVGVLSVLCDIICAGEGHASHK